MVSRNSIRNDLAEIVRRRKNLLLKGRPGIGKTTIVRRVLDQLKGVKADGFFTEEIRERGERKGFLIKTLDGMSRVLSHVKFSSRVRVGRYGVDHPSDGQRRRAPTR